MHVTKEIWDKIEQYATNIYYCVELLIDEYQVSITTVRDRKNPLNLFLAIYINGRIRGEWLLPKEHPEHHEIRRRFLQKKRKLPIRATESNIKKYGKRFIKSFNKKNTFEYYDPYWTSFRKLKAHLIKNNNTIELTGPDYLLSQIDPPSQND